jgi:predicted Zn finger-like uncharacterized protein
MIVTCPGCGSKYRVRNESVPTDGARMKCPKCETMFLAKPPVGPDTSKVLDEPSSQFQQLAPQPTSSPAIPALRQPVPASGQLPPNQPAAAAAPKAAASGPVTALFGAFDASQLPPEMQRPPAPAKPPQPSAPSGLEVDTGPKVHTPVLPTISRPTTSAPVAPRPAGPPSRQREALAWAAVGVGGFVMVFGFLVFAWATEMIGLDGMMLPVFSPFGAAPLTAVDEPSVDELREQAKAAVARGDAGGGILLWSRVRARAPDDPVAKTEIPRLRSELGERQST